MPNVKCPKPSLHPSRAKLRRQAGGKKRTDKDNKYGYYVDFGTIGVAICANMGKC